MEVVELDYTASALWEEIKFDFKFLGTIKALAIISDKKWLEESMQAFGSIIPTITAQGFESDQVDQAIEWLQVQ